MLAVKIIVAVLAAVLVYITIDHYILVKNVELLKDAFLKNAEGQCKVNKMNIDLISDIISRIHENKKEDNP